MILNFDAVKSILLFIEENLDYLDQDSDFPSEHKIYVCGQIVTNEYFSKYHPAEVAYALELLIKEKYISTVGNPIYSNSDLEFAKMNGLEMKGHELLDNIRDDKFWDITKRRAKQVTGVSLSVLASGAKALATAWMTDPNAFNNLVDGFNNVKNIL